MSATVTYVGHATVLIEMDSIRVLTDPVMRRRFAHIRRQVPDPAPLPRLDAALVSHLHRDHLDLPSLRGLGPDVLIVVPPGAAAFLRRKGIENARELAVGEALRIGEVEISATPADHDGHRMPRGYEAETVGYRIVGSRSVYFAGDTDLFDGMGSMSGTDLALIPVWGWGPNLGDGHLDPQRAAEAAALIRPRVAVPIHWGTFFPIGLSHWRGRLLREPPRDFAAAVAELAPEVDVRVLEPGASTDLSTP